MNPFLRYFLFCLWVFFPLCLPALGQVSFIPIPALTEAERELRRLRAQPSQEFFLRDVSLHQSIIFLAEAAEIDFLAPESSRFGETVSLRTSANALSLLELLGETFGFEMTYRQGLWHFIRIDLAERISRVYQIKYFDRELASPLPLESRLQGRPFSDLEAPPREKSLEIKITPAEHQLVQEIKELIAGEYEMNPRSILHRPFRSSTLVEGAVIYVPENRTLFVTATRGQHRAIEQYLEMVDRPRRLISIETVFVETSHEPSLRFGLDWRVLSGQEVSVSGLGPWPLQGGTRNSMLQQAILSVPEFAARLDLLAEDRRSTVAQFPRVVTLNQRPVSMDSVLMIPFERGRTSLSLVGSSVESQIEFLEVGTTVKIHPAILDGVAGFEQESVHLKVSVVISSQAGSVEFDGRSFPLVSSRTYQFEVAVPSGHVLAVGGLKEPVNSVEVNKIPILGDVPILGAAFRSTRSRQRERDMIAFITPRILEPTDPSFAQAPASELPSFDETLQRFKPRPSHAVNHSRRSLPRGLRSR